MSLWFIRLVSLYSAIPPVCLMVCRGDIFIDNSNQVLTHISYCDILYVERLFILRGDIPMYIRKEEKINIIKWFIRKWSCGGSDLDLENINNLKKLESIVRNEISILGPPDECRSCCYEGRDYCEKCKNCVCWNWGDCEETSDNYSFRYAYYKKIYEYETGVMNG